MADLISLGVGIEAHRRINSIRSDLRQQKMEFMEGELSARSMRQDIEKLYLIVEALWAIAKKSANLSDDDLMQLIREIDMQDGKLDGRNSSNAEVLKCPACGRTILRGQTRCSYCGEEMHDDSLFRHNGK